MLGSKLARLPRQFVRSSTVTGTINPNLRPKISNYTPSCSASSSGVQNTVGGSFYCIPESAR